MERKKIIIGSMMSTFIIVGLIVGMLMISNIGDVVVNKIKKEESKEWEEMDLGGPSAGEGGMIVSLIYPHTATPGTTYGTNLTGANSSYVYSGHFNDTMAGGTVPYDTAFDIVIQCRFNSSQALNTSNNSWTKDWVRAYINCTELSISSVQMSESIIAKSGGDDTSGYLWITFYVNNGGAGYTVSHGQTITIDDIKIQAYT